VMIWYVKLAASAAESLNDPLTKSR
jgi:hypothetical protein